MFFKPLIGKEYQGILVLGESHYCDKGCVNCGLLLKHPECADFTTRVINDYLDPNNEREGWMNTYLKFERSLVGHETTPDESVQIWNGLAFYNYLQVAMGGPRQAGTAEQYKVSEFALFEVMNQLQPKLMIVWGKQLWKHLPSNNWQDDEPLIIKYHSDLIEHNEVGYYTLPNGHIVHALCIYHPSAGYDWSYWHSVINAECSRIERLYSKSGISSQL